MSCELSVHLDRARKSINLLFNYRLELLDDEKLTRIAYERRDLVVVRRISSDAQHGRFESQLLERLLNIFCSHSGCNHAEARFFKR